MNFPHATLDPDLLIPFDKIPTSSNRADIAADHFFTANHRHHPGDGWCPGRRGYLATLNCTAGPALGGSGDGFGAPAFGPPVWQTMVDCSTTEVGYAGFESPVEQTLS